MTAKHTPGPWSYSEQRGLPGHCMVAQVWGPCGEALASVEPSIQEATATADARLIAAAPEMYQLIEKCYKVLHLGVWEVDETDEGVCSQINDIMCNHFGDDWRPRREACD